MRFDEFMSLAQVRGSFEDLGYSDKVVELKKLDVDVVKQESGSLTLVLGNEGVGLPVGRSAESSLKALTGLSPRMYSDYVEDPDLVRRMINHSLHKRQDVTLRLQTARGMVLAVHDSVAPAITPTDILNRFQQLDPECRFDAFHFNERNMQLEWGLMTRRSQEPPKRVGEASHAGIHVTCNGYVQVAPYVVTLVCTNGMLGEHRYPASAKTNEDLSLKFDEILSNAILESTKMLNQLIESDSIHVQNVGGYLAHIGQQAGLNQRMTAELVRRSVTLRENSTAYDVTQLITATANELEQPALKRFGWQIQQSFSEHRCSHCASVIA